MNKKLYFLLALSAVSLVHCSPGGFKSQTTSTPSSLTDTREPLDVTPIDPNEQRRVQLGEVINGAEMTGMAINSSTGVPNIDFDRKAGAYLIRIPMISFPDASFDMTFNEYPGMRLFVEYVSLKPFITLSIPVKYVLRNVTEVPAKLPNGDVVPLFPAGEPPSKGIVLTPNKERKIYLYLSAEAFGLFAETSFDPGNIGGVIMNQLTFPIQDKGKTKVLGYLSYINRKGDFKGGFFVSHRIDPKLGKILDEYYLN